MHEALPSLRLQSRLGVVHDFSRIAFPRRWFAAGLAAISSAVLIIFFMAPVAHPQKLTAAELIAHARASVSNQLPYPNKNAHVRRVVYQKVELRRGSRAIEREVVLRAAENAADLNSAADPEWSSLLVGTPIDWRDPLGVERYDQWRQGEGKGEDKVSEADGFATLTTIPISHAPVGRASLTVREGDWHTVAKKVDFDGQPSIEVRELDYGVRELPVSEQAAISPESLPQTSAPAPQLSLIPPRDKGKELDEVEISLREVFHRVGADVEEVPEITREASAVHFQAFTPTCARKAELLNAVAGLASVVADVSCPDTPSPPVAPSPPQPLMDEPVYSSDPPLAKALEAYLGDLELSNAYIHSLRDLYRRFLVSASALQRLADRYSGPEWERLSPDLQVRVSRLAADHIRSIQTTSKVYLQQVSFVLEEMIAERKLVLEIRPEAEGGCESWLEAAKPLAESLRNLQSTFQLLFVEEKTKQPVTLNAAKLLLESARQRADVNSRANRFCQSLSRNEREP
ncbi:MAG TPA: hypothetical protein VEV17_24780 [Bryobacteraceae bacterium]|nr:hypothetical protein [Bryobacteraceae bacterium]